MENTNIIGKNIRRIREEQGMSAYKLSKLSGLSQSTISKVENGLRQDLKSSSIEALSIALRVPVSEILSEVTETNDLTEAFDFILDVPGDFVLEGESVTIKESEILKEGIDSLIESIIKERKR